jgi:hypothetical protein
MEWLNKDALQTADSCDRGVLGIFEAARTFAAPMDLLPLSQVTRAVSLQVSEGH